MPSEIGMIADRYVMRAPFRYSGIVGPGTLVTVQLASGARCPMPRAEPASSRADTQASRPARAW